MRHFCSGWARGASAFGLMGVLGRAQKPGASLGAPLGLRPWEGEGHSRPESGQALGPCRATHNGPQFPELYCWQT